MREADALVLEALREGVARNVDPDLWESVTKQVAEVGFRGLTGSARTLVESLVTKHGSHDQSSHGRGRGGGSGDRGGKSGGKPTVRQMQSAATFLDNQGDVPSEAFAPTGIGNMGESQARAMIDHARKLGWKDED